MAWLAITAFNYFIIITSWRSVGISLIIFKRQDKNKPIPFGPYLATASWFALIWGEQLNASYWQLMALL